MKARKGSKYDVQIEWETGVITFEPLEAYSARVPFLSFSVKSKFFLNLSDSRFPKNFEKNFDLVFCSLPLVGARTAQRNSEVS